MHDGVKMILRDVPCRTPLDNRLNLRLLVEVIDVFLAVDQHQLLGSDEVVQQNDLIVVTLETIVLADAVVEADDL